MVSSTIDHMIAVTVFLAATLLFIGLFNQTIQTAVIYQRHRATATKASDLLDSMLLSPGIPLNWGQTDGVPTGFGLQDPEFTQYKISPFSLMRLSSEAGDPVYYYKTGATYSNITMGSKNFLLVANTSAIDYSSALRLLGINNTYGFQLTMTPIVTVEVTEEHAASPLQLSVNVQGTGFPLANAEITCCLITVSLGGGSPTFNTIYRTEYTDDEGVATVVFPEVTNSNLSYGFVAYAHLSGLVGVGYHERVTSEKQYVIPFVDSISDGRILIAHSYDIHYDESQHPAEIKYNASFVFFAEDFTLREMPLVNSAGHVNYGDGSPYEVVNIPPDTPGILIITYKKSANEGGVVMMPWGLSSLAFSTVFGGDPTKQEWVATDMRQVTVGGIAYQAKIAVWNLEGYQVVG